MALDRDEFITEICDTVGKKTSAAAVSGASLETRVRNYLNWGQKRIAKHYNFHELNKYVETAATVVDVKRYPLVTGTNNLGLVRPKDINSIRLIDSENSRKLDRWHYRKFDRYFPRPENYTGGRPRIYVRYGMDVEFYRIPNAVYTLYIRYPQFPTPFASSSQESDFNDKDQLVLTAGIFETYLALEQYNDAKIYWEKFIGQLKDSVRAEGDVDWEPEAEPHGEFTEYSSGEPWADAYGTPGDPLYGYSD